MKPFISIQSEISPFSGYLICMLMKGFIFEGCKPSTNVHVPKKSTKPSRSFSAAQGYSKKRIPEQEATKEPNEGYFHNIEEDIHML
ncbi:hypothetical protein VN97_g10915 [Penicillium thymicola]|uniref:Uncharacterized protein n=1 Tax=Penicillium thymicola TaxID=293382 RepID=A0AAI9T958_PENTH|nr:hypothetical protein VN97_g10915 [Penicillium thymicola]